MSRIPTEGYEVHDRLNKDLLQLMAVDAHTLYVYWEVSDRKRWMASQHFGCDWGTLPKVIRLYDVTCVMFNGSNDNGHFDIETNPESSSWYMHNLNANATYIADFGVYTWERQFIPLLRSAPVITPRDYSAVYGEPILPVIEEARDGIHRGRRIMPRFHENFSIYEEYAK
ncbi:DUF4912 domain-containing protein [Gorillibacterium sp. sgz5001074]|uniref:DUF4912 domain-containing protein n=1 Tax=Gorillibacterium sp. sgz5001074 TaxID=3446695 RepID=UPI003F663A66